MSTPLLFTPIGGLGEIGMNMMLLECGNDAIIIDCGVMFPETTHFGVDIIIPDFTHIKKNAKKIRALVLTHGHEDHIGAVPYLLRDLKIPIYASKFTLALVREKLREYDFKVTSHEAKLNKKISLGCFKIEFLQVSHSIVDGTGLAIETPQGMVIHTADFKIDPTPYRGKQITLQKFKEYGNRGVLLLLSDSTNVEREGQSLSEQQIQKSIFSICEKSKERIVFSVFATNVRRVEQVLEMAARLNRKVVLMGRSIETNVPLALKLGFINQNLSKVLIESRQMRQFQPKQLIVVCTGSQAEERSALWRMSIGEHKEIKIQKGDTVILSSKSIPGNEKAISHLINNLYRLGAEVFYEKVAKVHVSGHAYANELRQMILAVKPKFFIPVHGEYRHLVRHKQLAESLKMPNERIFVCENGDRISFSEQKAKRLEPIEVNRTFVDREGIGDVGTFILKDRRQLSETGVVFVILVRNDKDQTILAGPHLFSKGVIPEEGKRDLFDGAKKHLLSIIESFEPKGHDLQEEIRIETRRFFKQAVGIKPVVLPMIVDL